MTQRNPQLATSFSIPQKNRIPGYGGFCPTVRTNYGLTYGSATKTFYEVNRRDILNTSVKPLTSTNAGGGGGGGGGGVVKSSIVAPLKRPMSAASVASNNPWDKPLPYSLHLEGHRRDNVFNFEKSAQTHRSFYKDHSGTVQTIPGIHQRRHSAPCIALNYRPETPSIKLPSVSTGSNEYSRIKSATGERYIPPVRKGSAKERAVRNAFFEKR